MNVPETQPVAAGTPLAAIFLLVTFCAIAAGMATPAIRVAQREEGAQPVAATMFGRVVDQPASPRTTARFVLGLAALLGAGMGALLGVPHRSWVIALEGACGGLLAGITIGSQFISPANLPTVALFCLAMVAAVITVEYGLHRRSPAAAGPFE